MRLTSIVICLAALLFTGCFRWQENVTLAAVEFEKARVDKSGTIIGRLPEDRVVQRRPCRQGWLHLHPNGVPSGFTAADFTQDGKVYPKGQRVSLDEGGKIL